MTQAEFIAYAQIPQYVTNVNIWYTETPPYTILGITVPTISFSGENIVALLDQVEQIIIPGDNSLDITLDILTRQIYTTVNGSFYFFTVTPYEIGTITTTSFLTPNADITFTPAIDSNVFSESPYNALYGVVEDPRKSTYLMLSDRYKIGTVGLPGYTGPTNIEQLLKGSASRADVQDSLYSDTGWINARYEGTEQVYTGTNVSPSVSGKTFSATEYPLSTKPEQISYQVSSSLAIFTDYFYTGIEGVPGIAANIISSIEVSGSLYAPNTGYLIIKGVSDIDPTPYLPSIGSTVAFDGVNQSNMNTNYEVVYITGITLVAITPIVKYQINIIRRYNGTPQSAITTPIILEAGDKLYNITPTQIYQLQKNKLIGVGESLLLVEETGKVLTLNSSGYVIGST